MGHETMTDVVDAVMLMDDADDVRRLCEGLQDDRLTMAALFMYQRYRGAQKARMLAEEHENKLLALANVMQTAASERIKN